MTIFEVKLINGNNQFYDLCLEFLDNRIRKFLYYRFFKQNNKQIVLEDSGVDN